VIWRASSVSLACHRRFKIHAYMAVAPNVTPPASGLVRTPKRSQTNAARAMPLTPVTPAGRSTTRETRGSLILNRLLSPRHVPTPSPQESPLRDYSQPPFTQEDPKWQFGYITNFEPTPSPQESPLRDYSQPPFTQEDPKWQFGYITNFEGISHHLRAVDGVSERLFWRYFFKCQYCSCTVPATAFAAMELEGVVVGTRPTTNPFPSAMLST
jgi:hypothetical protein